MRIAFTTFGCKINQYETDQMRHSVASEGNAIVPFDDDADVYIINTCSVTAKSDYQCRQAIRAAVRRRPTARVVVTGCYADTRPEEIRAIPGVSVVVGNREKGTITRHLPAGIDGAEAGSTRTRPDREKRTRGFLKIQDGCDSRCSYCIVPHARGASRSVSRREVIEEFQRAVDAGVPEVVLSGIHIGRYGIDLAPRETLTGLVRELVALRRQTRIRLSSIEPREVTGEIIGMLGRGLCRHLHIPLQSGDNDILRAMNRDYTAEFYRDLVRSIAHQVPGVALGADVMVGFPGEEERHFQNTLQLIEELPLTHLHVFSYSPRPGTPAALLSGQVPESIKKMRNEHVRSIGVRKNIELRKACSGIDLEAVIEDSVVDEGYVGLTDNYLKVAVKGAERKHISSLARIHVKEAGEKVLIGFLIDKDMNIKTII